MPERDLFGHAWSFWIAMIIAALLQAWARPPVGETPASRAKRRLFGIACGLFMGVYFTDPILVWRGLDPDQFKLVIGILLAFTGQAVVEFIVELNWTRAMEIFKLWRGIK